MIAVMLFREDVSQVATEKPLIATKFHTSQSQINLVQITLVGSILRTCVKTNSEQFLSSLTQLQATYMDYYLLRYLEAIN